MRAKLALLGIVCLLPVMASAKIVDRIAAIINGEVLTESEVLTRAYPLFAQIDTDTPDPNQNLAKKKQLLKETLQSMVDEKLLSAAAEELQITVSTEEVDRAVDQILKRNNLTSEDLDKALKQQGQSLKTYRDDIRDQLVRYKVIGNKVQSKVNISDEEALAYCESDKKSSGESTASMEVTLQQMIFNIPAGASQADIDAIRKQAESAIALVKKGQSFATVAGQVAPGQTVDLGTLDLDSLDSALADPLRKANPNDIVGPIRQEGLYRVVLLVDKKASATGNTCQDQIEDYRAALQERETQKVLKAYINELRKKAYIDIKIQY